MDIIRNKNIRKKIEVAPIKEKLRETYLRYYEHILKHPINALAKQYETIINTSINRGRERSKKLN